MTTYNIKLQHPGATLLYTPVNSLTLDINRSGIGLPFNVEVMPDIALADYIQTESLLALTTEDFQYLELD